MDFGPLVTALVAPLLAIVSGVVGLRLAQKLGVGPVQAQYVALLKGMTDTQQERITQLETENEDLRERVEYLEAEIGRLNREIIRMTRQERKGK